MAEGTLELVFSGISAVTSLVEFFTKGDDCSVGILKSNINKAWHVIQEASELQLRGRETSYSEKEAISTLTKWCYDAEDLVEEDDRKQLKHIWGKLTNPKGEKLKACEEIQHMLKILKDQSGQSKTMPHQCNGIDHRRASDTLVGRESDIEEIVQKLASCDRSNKYGVCIVGMSGIGKSLLASTIFEKPEICTQFPHRVWVDVKDGSFVWGEIERQVRELLGLQQKLLIVFDNMLHVDQMEWGAFQEYKKKLIAKSIDVRIMVTTRSPTISKWNCFIPYELGFLSDDACKEVILRNVHNDELRFNGQFWHAIESVVGKCEGLPLVATWLGIFIGVTDGEDIFEEERRLSQVARFRKEILPRLMSTYIDISPEIRRCIAYLSLFPSSHHCNIDDLFHLWVGECFLQPSGDLPSLKEIKKKYIEELQESLILQPSGKLNSFGLYFATLAASGTCLQFSQGVPSAVNEITRHLSLSCRDFNSGSWSQLRNFKKLRTLLSLCDDNRNANGDLLTIPSKFCNAFRYLRVLSLKGIHIDEIPSDISKSKHLRYLDISFTPVKELPSKLLSLHATLQFLKCKGTKISYWQEKFYKMKNLLYVDWEMDDISKLGMPRNIGKLFKLESLPLFIVGTRKGYLISELKEMNNLRGSICIRDLEHVKDTEQAKAAMLHLKHDLETIVLEWKTSPSDASHHENVLTGLQPHNNVRELKLIKYGGQRFPNWVGNALLKKIHLFSCRSCNFFPVLGRLKRLTTLILEDMDNIIEVSCRSPGDIEGERFPSLETLRLYNMTHLQSFTGLQEGDMPCLQELKIVKCVNLVDMSFRGLLPAHCSFITDEM